MRPMLSIILISWNSRPMLERCLLSLSKMYARPDVEIIWVDNGSSDGASQMVASLWPGVRIVGLDRNYGVAYARNRGLEMSRGKYLLLLDDDTESTSEVIDFMVEYMDANPDVGVCACALRDACGNLQASFKPYPGLGVKVRNVLKSWLKKESGKALLPKHMIEPEYVIGACQLIRREAFDKVGLLDERIFYGPEDADFCIRVRKAGYRVCYLPTVSIMHRWRRISNRNPFSRISRLHIKALLYFYLKHRRLW